MSTSEKKKNPMTEEAAKRIKKANEGKPKRKKDGFPKRADEAAERNSGS